MFLYTNTSYGFKKIFLIHDPIRRKWKTNEFLHFDTNHLLNKIFG